MKIITAIATLSLTLIGCSTAGKRTAVGTGIGAAVGGIAGAVIGHQSGNKGKGAAIGAAIGGLAGGGYGAYLDKQAAELEKIAETRRTEKGIVTKLKGDILFSSGSSSVTPSAQSNVRQISAILAKYPEDIITIMGHTDSTGSNTTNQSLSQSRAQAIQQIMVQNGVPGTRVSAIGMGEGSPIASNATSEGRAQNRRVEIQITVDESKFPAK